MMNQEIPPSSPPPEAAVVHWPTAGRIDGWRDFSDRVCAALAWASQMPCDLILSDLDFKAWPLGQRAAVEAFQTWALGQSSVRVRGLLADPEPLVRAHPRWLDWRQRWAHRVEFFRADDDLKDQVPTLLLVGDALGLKLHDVRLGRGTWSRDADTLKRWHDEVDVILQRSSPTLPVTTLGL
jgi:hypothetical protein